MGRKYIFLAVGGMLILAPLACTSPFPDLPATQTSAARTAEAMLWTDTPTVTPTNSQTPTAPPTAMPKPTATTRPTTTLDPDRYYETAGNAKFSYIPPKDWSKGSAKTGSFSAWRSPQATSELFCMITFDEVQTGWMAAAYAAILQDNLLARLPDYQVGLEDVFDTDTGVDSFYTTFTFSSHDIPLFGMLFVFQEGDRLVYGIYTRDANGNLDQDEVITQSMKTFRFE
jgi:hypothetical protein